MSAATAAAVVPQLFSIEQTPRALPIWETIIDDLGRPPAHRIAHALGVGVSTVYRWNAVGGGPRIAQLALFWLTRWGRSAVNAQATTDAILAVQLARSLGEEREQLRRQVEELDRQACELALDLAKARRQALEGGRDRGSAAIAAPSHTGTHPAAASELLAAPASILADPRAWPTLPAPVPELQPMAWPALDWMEPQPAGEPAEPAAERPGTPAAPPPAVRSGTTPGPGRSPRPRPSAPREASLSSPSLPPDQRHDDAIMASDSAGCGGQADAPEDLFYMGQAPAPAAAGAAPAAPAPTPAPAAALPAPSQTAAAPTPHRPASPASLRSLGSFDASAPASRPRPSAGSACPPAGRSLAPAPAPAPSRAQDKPLAAGQAGCPQMQVSPPPREREDAARRQGHSRPLKVAGSRKARQPAKPCATDSRTLDPSSLPKTAAASAAALATAAKPPRPTLADFAPPPLPPPAGAAIFAAIAATLAAVTHHAAAY